MKKSQFAIIIAVIVLGLGGIFGYVKYRLDNDKQAKNKVNGNTEEKVTNNNSGNNQDNQNIDIIQTNNNGIKVEEGIPSNIMHYQVNDDVKEYLNMIPTSSYYGDVYTGDNITIKNIEGLLIHNAYGYAKKKMNESEEKEAAKACENYLSTNPEEIDKEVVGSAEGSSGVLIKYVDEYLKNNYNVTSNDLESKKFDYYREELIIKKDNYFCQYFSIEAAHGMPIPTYKIVLKTELEEDSNKLIIKEKALFADCGEGVCENACKLSTSCYTPLNVLFYTDELFGNDIYDTLYTKLKPYEDQAYTFKHTFKKMSNGEYYWYSTEVM